MKKIIVIKIGGSTLGNHDTTLEDLVALQQRDIIPVVVHGGGKLITEWLNRQQIPTTFEKGLRVTDAQSLKVVIAVLAGLVNKELVAAIGSLGGRALGFSGIDGRFIEARLKAPELGYVGEVVRINLEPLESVIKAEYIPVIAPVGILSCNESNEANMPVNINADTVAGEIAVALGADRLVFLTDVEGVCDESGKFRPQLLPTEARALISSGVVSGGMVPKVEACLRALTLVATTQIIDGRVQHSLIAAVEDRLTGTRIERSH